MGADQRLNLDSAALLFLPQGNHRIDARGAARRAGTTHASAAPATRITETTTTVVRRARPRPATPPGGRRERPGSAGRSTARSKRGGAAVSCALQNAFRLAPSIHTE